MLYEKMLKQINTVFPKLQLKPPSKKSTVRSLIQQKEAPSFTAADIAQIKNKQTAQKAINKLISIINVWLKVIDNNERSRQQYAKKPVSMAQIQQVEYLIRQCRQIQGKSQFIEFLSTKAVPLYENHLQVQPRKYPQTQTLHQLSFYSTISQISEEQYFVNLQKLQQSLNIYVQLLKNQLHNLDHLDELYSMLENDQLFKKKDNALQMIVKYNISIAIQIESDLEREKKIMYYYMDSITFGIARIYYLIFVAESDITKQSLNETELNQIEQFVTLRKQSIFTKLHNRKILKVLIELQKSRSRALYKKYDQNGESNENKSEKEQQKQKETEIKKLKNEAKEIKDKLAMGNSGGIQEEVFVAIYQRISKAILRVQAILENQRGEIEGNSNQYIQILTDIKKQIVELEGIAIRSFVFGKQGTNNNGINGADSTKSNKQLQRRYLKQQQPRQKPSFNSPQKRTTKNINLSRVPNQQVNPKPSPLSQPQRQDTGQDIFLPNPLNSAPNPQQTLKINQLEKNQQKLLQECDKFIAAVRPEFGDELQDAKYIDGEQLLVLVEAIKKYNAQKQQQLLQQQQAQQQKLAQQQSQSPQKQGKQGSQKSGQKQDKKQPAVQQPPPPPPVPSLLSQQLSKSCQTILHLSRNILRPQLSQQSIPSLLSPKMRPQPLKQYTERLIEQVYKVTKSTQSPQFPSYPQTLKQFMLNRLHLLKLLNNNLSPIYKISMFVTQLPFSSDATYPISSQETYQIFLKMLLAQKQIQLYKLAFEDEKNVKKPIYQFIIGRIYQPFIESLKNMLPKPYHDRKKIGDVIEDIDFFVDFCIETQDIISNFIKNLESISKGAKGEVEKEKKQAGRILTKWAREAVDRVLRKRQGLNYQRAEEQLKTVNQIIKICNNGSRSQITDKTALLIIKILDQKI